MHLARDDGSDGAVVAVGGGLVDHRLHVHPVHFPCEQTHDYVLVVYLQNNSSLEYERGEADRECTGGVHVIVVVNGLEWTKATEHVTLVVFLVWASKNI